MEKYLEENRERIEREKRMVLIAKAEFYFTLNLNCHIKVRPVGFRNGKIISEFIEEGSYFKFIDLRQPEKVDRLFIDEIYDIKDYEEPIEKEREEVVKDGNS